ncbi:uncharacterized protein LOC135383884 [Ornithodoros turicata]|uniref:uncharacterized protein LOC135383884 n=1 Tax=Ornithodoros turicata TaxID=34597 RepID=UPI00313A0E3D
MQDSTAETVAATFLQTWIARFGVPEEIVIDRGPQFESRLFTAFTTLLGTKRLRTTAYHPACNGLVERFHRHLKQARMAHLDGSCWTEHLPLVLLGIRAAVKHDLGCSSSELVYGTSIRLPADIFNHRSSSQPSSLAPSDYAQRLKAALSRLLPTPTRAVSSSFPYVAQDLTSSSHVFLRTDSIRRSLQPPYSGPHKVIHRGAKAFAIDVNGREVDVSIDRLKPAYVEATSSAFCHPTLLPPDVPTEPDRRLPKTVTWAEARTPAVSFTCSSFTLHPSRRGGSSCSGTASQGR